MAAYDGWADSPQNSLQARITALEASLAEAKEHTLAAMEEATHFRQALAEAEERVAELQDLLRIERQHRAALGPF